MSERWKVVIIGGGFGGLSAAQQLNSNLVDVTVIDRRNYHLFQPLLYQVATGSLSAAGFVSSSLNSFSFQSDCHFSQLRAELVRILPSCWVSTSKQAGME
jgi:NADH dehydrogenase FAD-containing subunit